MVLAALNTMEEETSEDASTLYGMSFICSMYRGIALALVLRFFPLEPSFSFPLVKLTANEPYTTK